MFPGSLDKEYLEEFAVGAGSFVISSTAMVIGFNLLRQGQLYGAFFEACIAWSGYMLGHYSLTGSYIDDKRSEIEKPELKSIPGLISGSLIFLTGIIASIMTLSRTGYLAPFFSLMMFSRVT